ncbi:DedA family protein [Rhodobacter calidifons]|uniref:DedA family protein n=1 Tax=Rhodobacter calidifons TaxID=2715277 RepID=A0ABX0G7Z4_9RHOB|nr:DedA family protein [Rhodobacter calidifons]NHB77211.1 DedA family protein [Rhodobacter calidifons]
MMDWMLELVPTYGIWLLAATTFLSCLALPIPASILMLTAGGFVAAEEMVLWQTFAAAAIGGSLGDQVGYWTGRKAGAPLLTRLRRDPARDKLLGRAVAIMERKGLLAVFLTRWLISPLGPWVNLTAGSTGYGWGRFTMAGIAGEAVWAGTYVGAGYAFAGNVSAAGDLIGSVLGIVAGAAGVVILGYWLWVSQSGDADPALTAGKG